MQIFSAIRVRRTVSTTAHLNMRANQLQIAVLATGFLSLALATIVKRVKLVAIRNCARETIRV
jgi:hypothetical protein